MTRYGFSVNLDACCDHRGCMTACMRKNDSFPGAHFIETYTMMDVSGNLESPGTYFIPIMCQHCDNPSCVGACPHGVLVKRDDGLVVYGATDACVQCEGKPCAAACPYDAIEVDSRTGRIGKCDGCADIVDAGGVPECVPNCWLGTIQFGDLDDPASVPSQMIAQYGPNAHRLSPETGNGPGVHYLLTRRPWRDRENLYSPAWHDPDVQE